MSARKLTKRERAARLRAKEAQAKRDRRQPLTAIDVWAIQLAESYAALQRQGFTHDAAMDYLTSVFHKPKLPDWQVDNPDHSPYEDDDEDE